MALQSINKYIERTALHYECTFKICQNSRRIEQESTP